MRNLIITHQENFLSRSAGPLSATLQRTRIYNGFKCAAFIARASPDSISSV